jgi:hypothetical protein
MTVLERQAIRFLAHCHAMRRMALILWCLLCACLTGPLAAPPPASTDLPPGHTVLRKLVERAQSERTLPTDGYYLCTRRTVTEDMDSSGNVTERKVRVREGRSHRGGVADANKWSAENGFSLDEELLRRYEFVVEKREQVDGRATLVLNFVPKDPPPPVRQLQDRLLNQAVGTVWIDERESELVKAFISLGQPVSFGLLGAVHSFNFSFERGRSEDGNWFTRWTDTYVKARKFISSIQTRKRVDWTGFKKLSANAHSLAVPHP